MPGLRALPFILLYAVALISARVCDAQVNYVARFTIEKPKYLQGEPVFINFVIQNTGARTFVFRYRTPDRVLNRELENEPHFKVNAENGSALPDPAPKPCGGAKGSVVYGSVTLPPGAVHTERWLLNQWARISRPGRYHARAERRVPLYTEEAPPRELAAKPTAYALAINDLQFEITAASAEERRARLAPYVKTLTEPIPADPAEAVLVLVTLPQSNFLKRLEALARAPAGERRWDRRRALEGLARLGSPGAWDAIVKIARGGGATGTSPPGHAARSAPAPSANPASAAGSAVEPPDDALRAYAILLLGEKAEPRFIPALVEIIQNASDDLRGDALRTLGFFNNARANQVLYEKLHASAVTDRVNAILGLKNLGAKAAIPAVLATLRDPDAQVRQVANFALQGLTGQKFRLSPSAGRAESDRVAEQWRAWWSEHAVSFVPPRQSVCHEW